MTEFCATAEKLSVFFGKRQILHGVNLEIPAGKITVILGPSGSGKTTLLRSFNRLNECFEDYSGSGLVRVRLESVLRSVEGNGAVTLTQLRRRVGMVFQTPNPLPLSIRRNILLPLRMAASTEKNAAEEIMQQTLTEVGLWHEVADRLNHTATSLSGGQQQRLCLARALALKPEILLLDEPTASLDRAAAEKVEELLLSFKGVYSVIMISHSLAQARKLADHIVVLEEGRVGKTCAASEFPFSEFQHGSEANGFTGNQ